MMEIAKEIGIEIEFDSPNAGVTTLDEDGNVLCHKSYDEVWEIFKEIFPIKD